jgi:hypothetical protein
MISADAGDRFEVSAKRWRAALVGRMKFGNASDRFEVHAERWWELA